ncbi:MAG TPA: hypothetical protein VEQ63_14340, partial [Bryobacteraceae bacterium]|nr:hypothetical protein [Bryobacteraceae bacterium]
METLSEAKELNARNKALLLHPEWANSSQVIWSIPVLDPPHKLPSAILQVLMPNGSPLLRGDVDSLQRAMHLLLAYVSTARALNEVSAKQLKIKAAARRLLEVEEMERRRISRELHDG